MRALRTMNAVVYAIASIAVIVAITFGYEWHVHKTESNIRFFGFVTTKDAYVFPERPHYYAFLYTDQPVIIDFYTSLWCTNETTPGVPATRIITKYNRLQGAVFSQPQPAELEAIIADDIGDIPRDFEITPGLVAEWRIDPNNVNWIKPPLHSLIPLESGECKIEAVGKTFTRFFRLPMQEVGESNTFSYTFPSAQLEN